MASAAPYSSVQDLLVLSVSAVFVLRDKLSCTTLCVYVKGLDGRK